MAIVFDERTEQYLLGSIRRFFSEDLDEDIGDLKARAVLDFFVGELGPSVYNQAILDAQATPPLSRGRRMSPSATSSAQTSSTCLPCSVQPH